jgi:hypothetical protein
LISNIENKKGKPASGRKASENNQETSNPVLLFTGFCENLVKLPPTI